jgi:hypothetical protein
MARPISHTISATTTGLVVPVDDQQSPVCLRWFVNLAAAATISYTVQYTGDDVNDATWTPIWISDSVAGTAQTTSISNGYTTPIMALRIVVTAITGTARFVVLQGSSAR